MEGQSTGLHMIPAALDVRQVHKRFGVHEVLRGVTFAVSAGGPTVLLGPNGAGKTTLLRILSGYLTPDSGSITININLGSSGDRKELDPEQPKARRHIGYLPESVPVYPEMRVRAYVDYAGRVHGLRGPALDERVDRVLEDTQLTQVAHRRIGKLSRGYRQRVGLAQAIVHDPSVLLLDEPTSALDPEQIEEAWSLIAEQSADRVVLVSTHILSQAERGAHRLLILNAGVLIANTTAGELDRSLEETYRLMIGEARRDE